MTGDVRCRECHGAGWLERWSGLDRYPCPYCYADAREAAAKRKAEGMRKPLEDMETGR